MKRGSTQNLLLFEQLSNSEQLKVALLEQLPKATKVPFRGDQLLGLLWRVAGMKSGGQSNWVGNPGRRKTTGTRSASHLDSTYSNKKPNAKFALHWRGQVGPQMSGAAPGSRSVPVPRRHFESACGPGIANVQVSGAFRGGGLTSERRCGGLIAVLTSIDLGRSPTAAPAVVLDAGRGGDVDRSPG